MVETLRTFASKVELLPYGHAQRFVGVSVPVDVLFQDKRFMRYILKSEADYYEACFRAKYGGHYHLTLINSLEFKKLSAGQIDEILGINVEVEIVGLGRAQTEGGDSFYSVCRSSQLAMLRMKIFNDTYHFHVTLGFKGSDVHDVNKDINTLVSVQPFEKLFYIERT